MHAVQTRAAFHEGSPSLPLGYPAEWVERVQLADGRRVLVRPVLPQDAALHQAFVRSLSPRSRYQRFHGPVSELPEPMLRYLTDIDYVSHLALLATIIDPNGDEIPVAEARWVRREEPEDSQVADFALAVADDWQGAGLGAHLLSVLERSAARAGIERLSGDVLAANGAMRGLLSRLAWRLSINPDDARAVVAQIDIGDTRRRAANDHYAAAA